MVYILMAGSLLLTAVAVFTFCIGLYEAFWDNVSARCNSYAEWMHTSLDGMFIDIPQRRCLQLLLGTMALFTIAFQALMISKEWTIWWILLRIVLLPISLKLGWELPRMIVNFLWQRRLTRFDDQMLDALTLMSSALKAGLSFIQAMDTVVREMPNPIGQEFGLVLRHQQLGGTVNESLQQLERRMTTEDVRIIVTAILILRDTGGNLSETFDTMAFTIRERKKVKGKIQALTAQGIMQGIIIFCMPFVLGIILYVMDPVLISRMWQTVVGMVFLGIMAVLQILGGWLMKKMVTIEV
jgi:tight adherence protein B